MPNKAKAKNVQLSDKQMDSEGRVLGMYLYKWPKWFISLSPWALTGAVLLLIILRGIYEMSLSFLAIAGWFL